MPKKVTFYTTSLTTLNNEFKSTNLSKITDITYCLLMISLFFMKFDFKVNFY